MKPKLLQVTKLNLKTISTEQLQAKEKSLKLFIGIFIPLIICLLFFVVRDYVDGGEFDWTIGVIALCSILGGPVTLYPQLSAIQQELSSRSN